MMNKLRESGFLMAKIHQLAGRILTKKLKEYKIEEINPAQGRIMFVLWRQDEIPINELAKKTSLGKSTLTSMLDRLEETGFIIRVPSRDDRRKILIKRTEKDKSLQDLYMQISQDMIKLYYNGFAEEEIDQFESFLRRIFGNLSEFEKNELI
jgi:DNA-binding MarR family transcriptional regulator